jgi:hypothetical protein
MILGLGTTINASGLPNGIALGHLQASPINPFTPVPIIHARDRRRYRDVPAAAAGSRVHARLHQHY